MIKHPTSGKLWRRPRENGYDVMLPSGNVALLRPVALDVLMADGTLPDLLTPIAARTLWSETLPDALAGQAELAKGFAQLINQIVPAAMLSPRVVANPQADDEIALEDIDFGDKIAIFQLATQPAEVLRRFRNEQTRDVETVSDGEIQ